MPLKQEVKQSLDGHWKIGLFEAPCKAPLQCCFGCCCPWCMSCKQRFDILDLIGEPYVCCGGLCPCGPLGQPQDRNCMYLEGCCCVGWAISGNRFYVQTRFNRENTPCDDCIIITVCVVSWIRCIASCFMEIPEEIDNLVDCLIMTVNGCMLAQQQVEIEDIKRTGYMGPPPQVMNCMTPNQQQIMRQGKPPQQQMPGMGMGAPMGAPMAGAPMQAQPVQAQAMQLGRRCENLDWNQMQPHEQAAARTIGLNEYLWNNDQDGPLSNTEWRYLTPEQQQAAMTLGITPQKWDSD